MSGTITMTGEEYDSLHAEAEALRKGVELLPEAIIRRITEPKV